MQDYKGIVKYKTSYAIINNKNLESPELNFVIFDLVFNLNNGIVLYICLE